MSKEEYGYNPELDDDFSAEEEQRDTAELAWLGGLLESGAAIYMAIQDEGPQAKSYPYLSVRSIQREVLEHLYSQYGGSIETSEPNWKLGGYNAAVLIRNLEGFVASRRLSVKACEQWLNAVTKSEQVFIAQTHNAADRLANVSVEDYLPLVQDNAFVAGLIDNRGTIFSSKLREFYYPRIEVSTPNLALLEALQQRFKGHIRVRRYVGARMMVAGREFVTTQNTYGWQVTNEQAREVLRSILPYIKVQPYEGWDTTVSAERAQEREETVEALLEFILEEMELLAEGQIERLSTNAEIIEQFREQIPSLTTLRRRLGSIPPEIRKKREELLRRLVNVSETDVQAVIQAIIRELAEYEAGEIERLTNNRGWVEMGIVGTGVFNKRVVPGLPPEVAKRRQQILYSQATKDRNAKYGNPHPKKSRD